MLLPGSWCCFSYNYRLSDICVSFVVQSSYSCLCFQDILWPEFSIWNFFSAIITYQQQYSNLQVYLCTTHFIVYICSKIYTCPMKLLLQDGRKRYADHRRKIQYESDKKMVCQKDHVSCEDLDKEISEYASQRKLRIDIFILSIRRKHRLYLERVCPHF